MKSATSAILVGVVATVAGGLILAIAPEFFASIGGAFSQVWDHLNGTTELPNWGLYLLVIMSAASLIQLAARVISPKGPRVHAYNQDTFLNVLWRWEYIGF